MRKAGVFAFGTVLTLLAFASCGGKTEVTIELLDPCKAEGTSFREEAAYVEFAVFPGKCPDDTILAAGLTSSARFRKVVKSKSALPEVGDLPKEKFGFAAILRDEECGVIGFGCTNADLENTKKIIVAVRAWATPAGKNDPSAYCTPLTGGGCGPGLSCVSGNCKKANEDDAGGCSLTIAAAGKLPSPVVATAKVTGPAITATDSGFVMAYRDQDTESATGFLRAVVFYVSDAGVPGTPGSYELIHCAGKNPSDGVGAAYANGFGLITTSLPMCDAKGAGAVFLPFDDEGNVSDAAGPQNAQSTELTMGPVSSVAVGSADDTFEVIYRTVTATPGLERVVLEHSGFKTGVNITRPFGDGDFPFGLVATSPQVRALLANTGADVQIQVGPRQGDTLQTLGTVTIPGAASWASMTAWQDRVAVVTPATSGATLKVIELGSAAGESGSAVSEVANLTVGTGSTAYAGVAALRDHLFIAQAKSGGVTLHNLMDANGTIAVTSGGDAGTGSVELQSNLGDATLANFSGTQLAMAAARNRVGIVWLTKPTLADGDATGGWALLRCNE
jgi:hypothetical protein